MNGLAHGQGCLIVVCQDKPPAAVVALSKCGHVPQATKGLLQIVFVFQIVDVELPQPGVPVRRVHGDGDVAEEEAVAAQLEVAHVGAAADDGPVHLEAADGERGGAEVAQVQEVDLGA